MLKLARHGLDPLVKNAVTYTIKLEGLKLAVEKRHAQQLEAELKDATVPKNGLIAMLIA
jgi:hypothetical protein